MAGAYPTSAVTVPQDRGQESGHVLAIVLIIVTIAVFAMAATLQFNSTHLRTSAAFDQRSVRHYAVEASLNQVVSWLRTNSKSMSSAFKRDQFYSSFVRTASTVGGNDGVYPSNTSLKLFGTNDSALFSNDDTLGNSHFPLTAGAEKSTFNAAASFAALDFGTNKVRLTLLDGLAQDQSSDNAVAPLTDFFPVFRVDAMTHIDRGTHLSGYIVGSLVESGPVGFFGREGVAVNQNCDAYDSSAGSYSSSSARSSCPIRSEGEVCIQSNASVYGTVKTAGTISAGGSCSGRICGNLPCSVEGNRCSGPNCRPGSFPSVVGFDSVCPSGTPLGSVTVANNQTSNLTTPGASANCWNTVKIGNNATLVLSSTSTPYYFKSLDLKGDLRIVPDDASKAVEVWVESIDTTVNGSQMVNAGARPSQLKLVYLGTAAIKLNGNADFRMQFVAPNSAVTVQGTADYYGGIAAKFLTLNGNASVHYDQSLGTATASDIAYKLVQVTTHYR